MDEFSLIRTYFAPLAKGFPGSLNLTDDAGLLDIPPGKQLVVTKDAISAGVHFLGSESPDLIARKLLRTNLSDLAAMGAEPLAYVLALMLPKDTDEAWFAAFATGLREDQERYGIHLAGGDTTVTHGTLSLSLTAFGTVDKGRALTRAGAKPGDFIYVSGTLGDSALGLASLQGKIPADVFLQQRYLLPEPRLALGLQLHGIASACMDISDGLVQDMGHICAASGVMAEIVCAQLPVSGAAKSMEQVMNYALTGGDDYELLFTVPADKAGDVPQNCSRIGVIKEGKGVRVLDGDGEPMVIERKGYRHF